MFEPPDTPHHSSSSPSFEIRQTPTAGRGLFASETLLAGTVVLTTTRPSAHVVLRQYRKEVCAWCFAYDHGRSRRVRDPETGFAFCSDGCQKEWDQDLGSDGREGWVAIEKLVKASVKRRERGKVEDAARIRLAPGIPLPEEIQQAWGTAEESTRVIIEARTTPTPTKAQAKLIRASQENAANKFIVDSDTLAFLFSGLHAATANPVLHAGALMLAPHATPYCDHFDLLQHTTTYTLLASILPSSYLPHLTPELLFTIVSRDSRNSFGIRFPEGVDSSEFIGFGTWGGDPSMFNHSCEPTISKERVGGVWVFAVVGEVSKGEELYISYLGADAPNMTLEQRRSTLLVGWGFTCLCVRCVREDIVIS